MQPAVQSQISQAEITTTLQRPLVVTKSTLCIQPFNLNIQGCHKRQVIQQTPQASWNTSQFRHDVTGDDAATQWLGNRMVGSADSPVGGVLMQVPTSPTKAARWPESACCTPSAHKAKLYFRQASSSAWRSLTSWGSAPVATAPERTRQALRLLHILARRGQDAG